MSGFQASQEKNNETPHTGTGLLDPRHQLLFVPLFLQDLHISYACDKYQQLSLGTKLLLRAGKGLPVM